ncbi:MAG: hypothetical protein IPM77_09175 [Crocinitomicaceae bacterium]|nr:hypothetical protein [Crocinitomicaceae bacterium]
MRYLLVIAFLVSLFAYGQKAEMTIDTNRIRIGEQTVLRILFEYPNPNEDALIGWPQFDETITDKIEIIDKTVDYESVIDSISKTYLREQQITISVFEPGVFKIPAVDIEFNETVVQSNELEILVETVPVDTSKGIVDIKPIYEVEYSFSEMTLDFFKTYWYVFAGAGVLVALFLLFRLLKKYRKTKPEPEAPKIPAHIIALAELNELLMREQWKNEDKKEYYSRMTDTVRKYLEERFNIFALEKTTREILLELKNADISSDDKAFLKKILSQADMVKFAKFTPADEDGFVSLKLSIEFVEKTKKMEVESTNEPVVNE